jgi:hypothetical protein
MVTLIICSSWCLAGSCNVVTVFPCILDIYFLCVCGGGYLNIIIIYWFSLDLQPVELVSKPLKSQKDWEICFLLHTKISSHFIEIGMLPKEGSLFSIPFVYLSGYLCQCVVINFHFVQWVVIWCPNYLGTQIVLSLTSLIQSSTAPSFFKHILSFW